MSYDIRIVDRETKIPLTIENNHNINGGTYCVGGTNELWFNITYNYAPYFREVFKEHGEGGIHCIEGQKVADTIPWIEKAINSLEGEVDPNYWAPTPGNVRASLEKLLKLAKLGTEGEWEIT